MFKKLRENLDTLSRDTRESVVLRCRLAMIELKADLANLRNLTVLLVLALVGILTGVAVLAVWIAELLHECVPLCANLWTMIVGLSAIVVSLLIALFAWHHFRRRWVGLEQTFEELREDIAWFKEWASKEPTSPSEPDSPPAAPSPDEES